MHIPHYDVTFFMLLMSIAEKSLEKYKWLHQRRGSYLQPGMQAFTLSLIKIQINKTKILLNSVLLGYAELLRPRFVLSILLDLIHNCLL